jgi:hypothetical protein
MDDHSPKKRRHVAEHYEPAKGVLMPQIGRPLTDDEAVAVIDTFITGLSVGP